MTIRGLGPTLLIWIVLCSLPLFIGEWELAMFGQTLVYGIAAMSLAFIWGQVGLLCFGQSLFFGIGAYIMALTSKGMMPGLPDSAWLGLVLAITGGFLAAFLLGAALFFGRAVGGAYFGIVTIAAAVIAERIATNWSYIGGFNGLLDIPSITFNAFGIQFDTVDLITGYLFVLGCAFIAFIIMTHLQRSPFGTVLKGIRCDETRMASLGYNVGLWKTVAFGISGAVASLAGALFAVQFSFVSPAVIGFAISTEILIWTAVGGKEVLLAAMFGAVLVKYTEYLLSETIGQYWLLVIGILFIALVVLSPKGLLGRLLAMQLPARLRRSGSE